LPPLFKPITGRAQARASKIELEQASSLVADINMSDFFSFFDSVSVSNGFICLIFLNFLDIQRLL